MILKVVILYLSAVYIIIVPIFFYTQFLMRKLTKKLSKYKMEKTELELLLEPHICKESTETGKIHLLTYRGQNNIMFFRVSYYHWEEHPDPHILPICKIFW